MKTIKLLLVLITVSIVACAGKPEVTVGKGYTCKQYTNKVTKTRKIVLEETKPNGFDHINTYIKGYNE